MTSGPPPGALIMLNGTSSAGKTTLATEMQRQFAGRGRCWLVFGIDDFLAKVPAQWVGSFETGPYADEGIRLERIDDEVVFRAGAIGRAVLGVYHQTIASLARSGLNVARVSADAAEAWRKVRRFMIGLSWE